MAKAMGIRTGWVDSLTFGLGSGIAGIGGVALSQLTNVGPNLGPNYWIGKSPSFGFLAGMQTNTLYYISAIAGNDDGTGNVDLTDPCLDVSAGVEVTFEVVPSATISGNETICENETVNLIISFSGTPPQICV